MAYPKYDKRAQTQGTRPKRNGPVRPKTGVAFVPEGPTRLVITKTLTHGTGPSSARNGGSQVTHWPAIGKDGTNLTWTCPSCGREFVRDDLEASWRER